jgi:hypothetical protein
VAGTLTASDSQSECGCVAQAARYTFDGNGGGTNCGRVANFQSKRAGTCGNGRIERGRRAFRQARGRQADARAKAAKLVYRDRARPALPAPDAQAARRSRQAEVRRRSGRVYCQVDRRSVSQATGSSRDGHHD